VISISGTFCCLLFRGADHTWRSRPQWATATPRRRGQLHWGALKSAARR